MRPSGLLTLLTDFGTRDPFVGVMKGVVLARFPGARMIDLAHELPPQDVAAGAFWLARAFPWFPPGTVHVAVVDPGVGTSRAALVACAEGHTFVGPDNGLLAEAASADPDATYFRVDLDSLGLTPQGSTFHGRDVFAPLGALLASGALSPEEVGPPAMTMVESPVPRPLAFAGGTVGVVVVVDHFGNLLTNLAACPAREVLVAGRPARVVTTYGEGEPGEPIALVNAWGFWEIAVHGGNAARSLGASGGAVVTVRA